MMDFFKGTVTRQDWVAVGTILGVVLLVVAVFVFFVHAEQTERLTQLDSELASAKQKLQEALVTQRNFEKLREETERVGKLVEDFEKRLPDKREMPTLLRGFEALAAEVGVQVTLKTLEPVLDDRKETMPYEVVATGDFHRITSFINRLERHERYLKVSNLSISEQKDGMAEAKFTLSTYSFRQGKGAPGTKVAQATAPAATGGAQ
jgi:type IV pilus assembly protein PilO